MAEGTEIERKFLVDAVPDDLDSHPSEPIGQGYLVVEGSAEVRIRRREASGGRGGSGERMQLTVKSGSGRVRVEEEFEIDQRRFDSLWPLSEGRRVSKTRYRLPTDGGLTIELDVYTGDLAGLVTAEVEFSSEAASDEFEPPEWFGREVTDDHRYANRTLAVNGRPTP